MKLTSGSMRFISLPLILACFYSIAQDERMIQPQQLEETLEMLNGLVTDAPSRFHHDRAEVLFRMGRFEDSVKDYDMAVRFGRPHNNDSCWERGLAQYYAGDFSGGRDQFSHYHRVGALDIENGIWRFLCIAEEEGIDKAREVMLEYPRRVRPPFPALLDVYLGKGSADAVIEEATHNATTARERTTNLFNAHYYLAKYYQITHQGDRSLIQIREALKYKIPHFMYACAEADSVRIENAQKRP